MKKTLEIHLLYMEILKLLLAVQQLNLMESLNQVLQLLVKMLNYL